MPKNDMKFVICLISNKSDSFNKPDRTGNFRESIPICFFEIIPIDEVNNSLDLKEKTKSQKVIYKLNFNCSANALEGFFEDQSEKLNIKNYSKKLLYNIFTLKSPYMKNPNFIKKGSGKFIWLGECVVLLYSLHYLIERSIIIYPINKVHFLAYDFFYNGKSGVNFDKHTLKVASDNIFKRSRNLGFLNENDIIEKNKKLYKEPIELIKKHFSEFYKK